MGPPGICQLPLAIFQIPHLHAMVGRSGDNTIPVEIKLGDRHKIPMASIEVSKPTRHFGALHRAHGEGPRLEHYQVVWTGEEIQQLRGTKSQ